jgi:hypothetical protein
MPETKATTVTLSRDLYGEVGKGCARAWERLKAYGHCLVANLHYRARHPPALPHHGCVCWLLCSGHLRLTIRNVAMGIELQLKRLGHQLRFRPQLSH